jgi:hypothetical protein
MSRMLNSRSVAEHLYTLASLLEAEALRMNALRSRSGPKLSKEARDVRLMANQLWEADTAIDVSHSGLACSGLLSNGSGQLNLSSGQGRPDGSGPKFGQPHDPPHAPLRRLS